MSATRRSVISSAQALIFGSAFSYAARTSCRLAAPPNTFRNSPFASEANEQDLICAASVCIVPLRLSMSFRSIWASAMSVNVPISFCARAPKPATCAPSRTSSLAAICRMRCCMSSSSCVSSGTTPCSGTRAKLANSLIASPPG